MKFTTHAAAVLISLTPVLATAADADQPTDVTIPPVHVKVVVTSKYYGSFTKEQDVKVNETASFNNYSSHHSGVVYQGKCSLKPDASGKMPADIDDGVAVNITPVMISPDGTVGAENEVKATKFIRYNKFNSGVCGEIAFADSVRAPWSRSALLYHPNQAYQIEDFREHSDTNGDKDLRVTVSFSPAKLSAN